MEWPAPRPPSPMASRLPFAPAPPQSQALSHAGAGRLCESGTRRTWRPPRSSCGGGGGCAGGGVPPGASCSVSRGLTHLVATACLSLGCGVGVTPWEAGPWSPPLLTSPRADSALGSTCPALLQGGSALGCAGCPVLPPRPPANSHRHLALWGCTATGSGRVACRCRPWGQRNLVRPHGQGRAAQHWPRRTCPLCSAISG